MPTTADLKILRSWCGPNIGRDTDEYDAADLDERIARLDTVEEVAREVLREYQADLLLGGAVNFTVNGDYSQDASANLKVMTERINALTAIIDDAAAVAAEAASPTVARTIAVVKLTRPSTR